MHLEFVNADITYILQLIYEISGENIIWDPAIKGKTVSMTLKDVPWDEALDLVLDSNDLGKMYRGDNIIWISTKDKIDKFVAQEQAETKRRQQEEQEARKKVTEEKIQALEEAPLITVLIPTNFKDAIEIAEHIVLSAADKERGISVKADEKSDTIIITHTAAGIEAAKETIKYFDKPLKQVMIEARIVDASDDFSRDLGIKWNADASATAESMTVPVTAGNAVEIVGTGAGHINDSVDGAQSLVGGTFSTNAPKSPWGNIGINFGRLTASGLGIVSLDASLALAETNGTAKTLSSPKVIAQEGTEASISSGEEIQIQATENVAASSWPAKLQLTVKPTTISANDYITLTVNVSDDQRVDNSRKTTKTIDTTLMVKSGDTIVIGGIIKEKEGENVGGIPVLKDIPLLGWLFKAKTIQKTKTELLIFITPTVLPLPVI